MSPFFILIALLPALLTAPFTALVLFAHDTRSRSRARNAGLVAGANIAFAYLYVPAALAALIAYPFEVAAFSLVVGLAFALFLAWSSRSLIQGTGEAVAGVRELARTNRALHAVSIPLAVAHLWPGSFFYAPSAGPLMLAVVATSLLGVVHGTIVLGALDERSLAPAMAVAKKPAVNGPQPCEQPCG
jgi:hypothetical protein